MVVENKYGFAVLESGKDEGEDGAQKSPAAQQGLPLLSPEDDVARKKRPMDYIVCILVVVSFILILWHNFVCYISFNDISIIYLYFLIVPYDTKLHSNIGTTLSKILDTQKKGRESILFHGYVCFRFISY